MLAHVPRAITEQPEIRTTVITVQIPGKAPHDIVVGSDIMRDLPERMAQLGLSQDVLIISSPTIFGLYGDKTVAAFKAAGCNEVRHVLFPDGEEYKTIETWKTLLGVVHEHEEALGTKLLLVNLGGGVVGDVGAFVAACYERGRDYIQLPTTLLAQVDCGIGGKCGVNYRGKNLIGQFHQPRLVLADLSFLKTVPIREIRSGLAEAIKYGAILDSSILYYIEDNIEAILDCDLGVLEYLVNRCFRLKVDVVQKDEKDTLGIRAKLNFGHTVGHALEDATGYTEYAHGEAISVGMLCACEIAERLGMIDSQLTRRLETLLIKAGLPTMMSADVDRVMLAMQHDKKFTMGVNKFVLPTALGEAKLVADVDLNLVREVVAGRTLAS